MICIVLYHIHIHSQPHVQKILCMRFFIVFLSEDSKIPGGTNPTLQRRGRMGLCFSRKKVVVNLLTHEI